MVYEEYGLPSWCRIQINNGRRDALDEAIRFNIVMLEDTASVRGPGWYEASCYICNDKGGDYHGTSGTEPVVEDWVYEHAVEHVPPALKLKHDTLWKLVEAHDGQHECTDLTGSAEPYVGCTTLRLLALALWADGMGYRAEEWAP